MLLVRKSETILVNNSGVAYVGVRVRVLLAGVEQQLYSDAAGTPLSQAVTNANGRYDFWVEEGDYTLEFSIGGAVLGEDDYSLFNVGREYFDAPASAAISTPYLSRALDTVSALDLMQTGGLASAVRNREVTTADAAEITGHLAEAVDYVAAKQLRLDLPAGTYYADEQLVAPKPATIVGAGMGSTNLIWTADAATSGLLIGAGEVNAITTIQDLALKTLGVAVGDAIEIDYSSLISGGAIVPRAATHAKIDRVGIMGATAYTVDGWSGGIIGTSLLGMDVDNCRINGVYTGAYGSMPNAGKAISFGGSGSPVQLRVAGTYCSAWEDAVYTSDAEGIYIDDCEFVTVGRGYRCVNAGVESGLFITSTHMAIIETGIDLSNMADSRIRDVLVYNVADVTPLTGIILRAGTKNIEIAGNEFRRLGTVSALKGIDVLGGQDHYIGRNSYDISSSGTAINIDAAATRTKVTVQDYISASSSAPIVNASATSQFEHFRAYGGDLNSVYTDWKMPKQVHTLGAAATNFPAAWGATVSGGIVETTSIDVNTAVQRAIHPNVSSTYYTRRRTGGTWGAWT